MFSVSKLVASDPDLENIKSGVLIRSNIVLTAASILFDSQNRRYRHSDIKVTANIGQVDEQVRMAKAGIHHRKFNFHHGRNNIGMIVLRKPFQLIPGMNLTRPPRTDFRPSVHLSTSVHIFNFQWSVVRIRPWLDGPQTVVFVRGGMNLTSTSSCVVLISNP